MASGSEVSFNEGSPLIIRPDDSEDDLEASFDVNSTIASQNSSNLPLNGGLSESSERSQEQNSIVNPIKKEEIMTQWTFSEAECIELSDSEQNPDLIPVKDEGPMTWKFSGGECIDLLDFEQDPAALSIRTENSDTPWRFTRLEPVELSATEDGVPGQNQLPAISSIHEDMNHESTNNEDVIYVGMNGGDLQNKIANNKNENDQDGEESARSKMQHHQKMLAERALGRPLAEGADQLFDKLQTSQLQISDTNALDSNNWMAATIDPDLDPCAVFAAVEKEYEEKVAANRVNWVDEILYRKAQVAEDARLKRLELDKPDPKEIVPSEDVDEESDGELFVPQENTSSRKRSHATIAENKEVDGVDDDTRDTTGNPLVERGKAVSKKMHANHLDSELEANMLAGIELFLAKFQETEGQTQTIVEAPNHGKAQEKTLRTSKGKVYKTTSRRIENARKKAKSKKQAAMKADCLNDINKLLNSDIYEEANNNQGCRELPAITLKDKRKALTALIADIPLEQRGNIRGQKTQILKCVAALGRGRVRLDGEGGWKFKGMTSSLMHHQIQGVSWMHEREIGNVQPLGGLQADEMGFGKTVMMIAAILANPPGPNDSKCTLIVCTPALLTQWINEIERHVEEGFLPELIRYQESPIMLMYGKKSESKISKANIVLTTYQEVVRSYPKSSPPQEFTTAEESRSWWMPIWQTQRGLLHRIPFFRVVLDEAQFIKNYRSQTSIACRALMSKHRWAISGTPIYNTIGELFPYFRFLRLKHTGTFDEFQKNFCNLKNPDSLLRIHAFLKQIMTRRTHKDRLFGAPLVMMPENHQATVSIEFNLVERAIYERLQRSYIEVINNHSRAGRLEKSYHHMLTMLLRLRQLTAHAFMLPDLIEDLFNLEDVRTMEEIHASELNANERDMLSTMRKMIQTRETPKDITEDITSKPLDSNCQGEEDDDDDEYPPFVAKFRKFLRNLANSSKWIDYNNRTVCHRCKDQPDDPWVTDCEHLYCYECLEFLDNKAGENGELKSTCLQCGRYITSSHPCRGIQELGFYDKDITSANGKAPKQKQKQKKKQKNPDEEIKWINLDGKLLLSSKVLAVQTQIENWLEEDRTKKIIVFGQFRPLLTILERMCEQKEWGHLRYDGKMNISARDKTLEMFRDDADKLIMVASLKCGGVGLNLTMASRVICVDLWWNNSVEQQAFCRVFRIGQKAKTFVTRFVVEDSVDKKLQDMQKVKAKNIGAAIDDPKMLGKLMVTELLRLFGPVVQEDHKPIIVTAVDQEGGSTSKCVLPPYAITESEDSE